MASFAAAASSPDHPGPATPAAPASSSAIPGASWTTMRCADPKCVELHKHTQVFAVDSSSSASASDSSPSQPQPAVPAPVPPHLRVVTPLEALAHADYAWDAAPPSSSAAPPPPPPPPPHDSTVLSVVGTAGVKVTVIRDLEPYGATLTTLVLRSNLVSSLSGVECLTRLEKLELYDNSVEDLSVEQLQPLSQTLRVLDLSFNSIRSMAAVACCSLLEELYLAQNKLKVIEGLGPLQRLQILDLGANRLRDLGGADGGLAGCSALESLWLGKNKIEGVGGGELRNLRRLVKLDIQNNRLTALAAADLPAAPNALKELYLACNGLQAVDWLGGGDGSGLLQLQTLDLSRNPVTSLAGVEAQAATLEELWLTGVALRDAQQLEPLRALTSLSCIYLEHSPLAKTFLPPGGGGGGQDEYQHLLLDLVPSLTQIDALCLPARRR